MPQKRKNLKNHPTAESKFTETMEKAHTEVDTVTKELERVCAPSELQDVAVLVKRLLRTTIMAMAAGEQYFQHAGEQNNELRNRVSKVFHDCNLAGYGFPYNDALDPVGNLILMVQSTCDNMHDGRLYVHLIREVLPTDDDVLIAAAARKVEYTHEWPIPEEVHEIVKSEVDEILHNDGDH